MDDIIGSTGNAAVTAYRLAMRRDGTVPVADMMAAWNVIARQDARHGPTDLPADMRREGSLVISERSYDPLLMPLDDIIAKAFRLSGEHRAPDRDGWHAASNVVRTANALGARRALKEKGDARSLTYHLRDHPMFETRLRGNVLLVRHRLGDPERGLEPVATEVLCLGDESPRILASQPTFGAAYRALLDMPRDLVTRGTHVRFHRGGDARTASYEAAQRWWMMSDGTRMRRTDAADPALHTYRHGHLVETMIGFVTRSRSGRIHANVGRPVDEPGDHDAFVHRLDRREADSLEDALALLDGRNDLDHVFRSMHNDDGAMGYWLSGMRD